jgi:hypothetical protein
MEQIGRNVIVATPGRSPFGLRASLTTLGISLSVSRKFRERLAFSVFGSASRDSGTADIMEISEDFRRRAARCIERARTPKSELAKATWLDMAQFWLALARQAERHGESAEAGVAAEAGVGREVSARESDARESQPRANGHANGNGHPASESYGPPVPVGMGQHRSEQGRGGNYDQSGRRM